jgi:hypothetical protein
MGCPTSCPAGARRSSSSRWGWGSLGAVLANRYGVAAATDLVPAHPTLGDVDSPQALADYQAAKRLHKAEWSKARAEACSKVCQAA